MHVQYLRELFDKQVIHQLVWLDTRDMGADGLTKGAVSRDVLHRHMHGFMPVAHLCEKWRAPLKGNWGSGSAEPVDRGSSSAEPGKPSWMCGMAQGHDKVCTLYNQLLDPQVLTQHCICSPYSQTSAPHSTSAPRSIIVSQY